MKDPLERELKLSVSHRFRLPDLPGEPLPLRRLTSVYFDTPGYRLARAGITLRRRTESRRKVWQLKLPRKGARLELEFRGGSSEPPGRVLDLLFAHLRGTGVHPVATLRTRRAGVRVQADGAPLADVTLDSVVVLDGNRVTRRFREVEIERLDGNEALVRQLEADLRTAGAGDHDGRPKLFRAVGLELPIPPSEPPPTAPVGGLLSVTLAAQLTSLLAHDPGVRLGQDPEDLHQMRVAIRRLRAMLRAARPMLDPEWADALRAELKWVGNALGPARDRDVLLEQLLHEAESLEPPERRAFERLLGRLKSERREARRQLMEVLQSDRYLKLLDRLEQAVQAPAVVTDQVSLAELAAAEFKKLRKAVRNLSANPSDRDLHRIRIRCKRARYAAELAETVTGKAATRFIKRTKALQDLLGEHQDAVVADERIRELIAGTRGKQAALAAGRILERQRVSRAMVRGRFKKVWTKLNKQGKAAWS